MQQIPNPWVPAAAAASHSLHLRSRVNRGTPHCGNFRGYSINIHLATDISQEVEALNVGILGVVGVEEAKRLLGTRQEIANPLGRGVFPDCHGGPRPRRSLVAVRRPGRAGQGTGNISGREFPLLFSRRLLFGRAAFVAFAKVVSSSLASFVVARSCGCRLGRSQGYPDFTILVSPTQRGTRRTSSLFQVILFSCSPFSLASPVVSFLSSLHTSSSGSAVLRGSHFRMS
ncbi:hypothetical protein QBC47DRAFT_191066 [Echria macrotheca]|uniref:Uncharacterized protein n=1 Tax=Echria macrotheca TaxID=438768 RepID=A0AAJ0BE10_9PEZI|nr:hypothetical protein QBC47DRAFT_191066 [Echria macrotheca]